MTFTFKHYSDKLITWKTIENVVSFVKYEIQTL